MKTLYFSLLSIIILCPLFAAAQNKQDSLAQEFLLLNDQGKYAEADHYIAPSIQDKISTPMLKNVWEKYIAPQGHYLRILNTQKTQKDSLHIIINEADFEKAEITFLFSFNKKDQITGYFIRGIRPKASKTARKFPEIDTTLKTLTGAIKGSIMYPKSSGKVPVALIIAGSGPVDRDGNAPAGDSSNDYILLAEALAKNNIASLRYDKRGVGESSAALTDMQATTLKDYINDAEGWIKLLEADKNFSKVVIIGHSEGSLIGMIAAREAKADAYISLAGAGQSLDSVLLMQLKNAGVSGSDYSFLQQALQQLKDHQNINPSTIPPTLSPILNPSLQPFLSSYFQYNPAQEIAKLKIPTLIINGTHDLQVPEKQARILAKADHKAKLLIIDSMNHVLKNAPANRLENAQTYMNPDLPLNQQLIDGIVRFINKIDE